MDTIQIPCPKCGAELKLRDRKLLGRKGKCPKCDHAFVLEEPEEVQLELAEPDPSIPDSAALASMEGSWLGDIPDETDPPAPVGKARWIPDEGLQAVTTTPPNMTRPLTAVPEVVNSVLPELAALAPPDGAAARLKALQKRNAKRRNVGLAVGTVVLAAVCGVTYFAMTNVPSKPAVAKNEPGEEEPLNEDQHTEPAPAVDSDFVKAGSPTKGKPIELQFIPFGAQIILNIHPAELWKKESPGEELRFCLTPVAKLMEAVFQDLFKRKPEQIEKAMICVIPGSQGSLPDVAAAIQLTEEVKKSQLLEDFGGERIDDYGHPVYISGERAYLIHDQKTIAVAPKAQASEMVDAIVGRNPASDGIDELLPLTDRDRHITVIFVPRTLRLHGNFWFPENLKPFSLRFCDWLGDEVESAAWSFHLGDKTFYSDMLLRNVTGVTSSKLERELRGKLDKLPYDLLDAVRMMNPREVGKRKVIGRVPKMSEAFAMSTLASHGTRHVQLITPLPERAAPNLALGTLLAWDESTRTDFNKKAATKPTQSEGPKLPDRIADRLKVKIDVDFRRTPLQEAYAYIAGELKTTIEIDGDALKAGGFTKNMPQTYQLEKTSAQDVIVKLLEKYQDPQKPSNTMVIVVDEEKKMILVTTLAFAEQKKLTPYDVMKK